MPVYEYDCPKCGTFEVSQKMSDPALTRHDSCGEEVQRRISLTAFSLKGSGWASDGYSSSGGKASASAPCGAGACATGGCQGGASA